MSQHALLDRATLAGTARPTRYEQAGKRVLDVVGAVARLVVLSPVMVAVALVDRHGLRDHPRHRVRPGITGLWQVTARGDGLLHEHTAIDLAYVQRISLREDLRILLATVPAALGTHRGV